MKKSKESSNSKEDLLQYKDFVINQTLQPLVILSQSLLNIHFVNEAFKTIFGSKEGLEKIHIEGCLLEDGRNLISFIETDFLRNGHDQTISEKLFCDVEYDSKYFEVTVFSLTWNKQLCIAVSFYDITERVVNLKTKNRFACEFSWYFMHEIRVPINGIIGIIDMIKNDPEDLKKIQKLTQIGNFLTRKLMMDLNSFLDIQHVKANNNLRLYSQEVNIYKALQEIISLFWNPCEAKGLSLGFKISPNVPKFIHTDNEKLKQILAKLVENAFKFTLKGEITISVKESKEVENSIEFSVQDTGIGIKDTEMQKLRKHIDDFFKPSGPDFQPFGFGIGVPIANYFAKLLNKTNEGGLRIKSVFGEGSSFSFLIRRDLANISSDSALIDELSLEDGEITDQTKTYETFIPNNTLVFNKVEKNSFP